MVEIQYERYFGRIEEQVVEMSEEQHRQYQVLKGALFDKHDKINPIIKGLAEFAAQCLPEREMPTVGRIFDRPDDVKIVRTDLKVDEYLAGLVKAKVMEVNEKVRLLRDVNPV